MFHWNQAYIKSLQRRLLRSNTIQGGSVKYNPKLDARHGSDVRPTWEEEEDLFVYIPLQTRHD